MVMVFPTDVGMSLVLSVMQLLTVHGFPTQAGIKQLHPTGFNYPTLCGDSEGTKTV